MQKFWSPLASLHILLIFEMKRNIAANDFYKISFSANINAQLLYMINLKNKKINK